MTLAPRPVRAKICGLRTPDDCRTALDHGADFLGFVFHPKSPRAITPPAALALLSELRGEYPSARIRPVGVIVDWPIEEAIALAHLLGLYALQIHGHEDSAYAAALAARGIRVIKAFRVRDAQTLQALPPFLPHVAAFLLDAYDPAAEGGTGRMFAHDLALPWIARHRILIAGGLNPDNAADVARSLQPFALDVSSGLESAPGLKDPHKIRAFLNAVRTAQGLSIPNDPLADPFGTS